MTSLSSGIVPSRDFYTGEPQRSFVLYVDTEEQARTLREMPEMLTGFTVKETSGWTREVRMDECRIEVRVK